MAHIVFFSYARGDLDPYLDEFFKDLCAEIAPNTEFEAEDVQLSYRDTNNNRVMENWKTQVEESLQSSAVLVCVTSIKYFLSEFCGKEYYVFDQRRRQGLQPQQDPPAVILPVIWAPVSKGLPDYMKVLHLVPKGVPDSYLEQGLRRLKRERSSAYEVCVNAFADAIVNARSRKIPRLPGSRDFGEVPNRFAEGDWQEAAGPGGWLPGPEVANFVFGAASEDEAPQPVGRHGGRRAEWRPYFPPEMTRIIDHARNVTRDRFKFREIPIDATLDQELAAARARKNLTVVVADPKTLASPWFAPVQALQKTWWEGTALVFPCDPDVQRKAGTRIPVGLDSALPVLAQANTTGLVAIESPQDIEPTLDMTLMTLRAAVTKVETDKKEKTDAPPTDVRAVTGG
jgi:hypothetical protein